MGCIILFYIYLTYYLMSAKDIFDFCNIIIVGVKKNIIIALCTLTN